MKPNTALVYKGDQANILRIILKVTSHIKLLSPFSYNLFKINNKL